jgi:hypothetical protein
VPFTDYHTPFDSPDKIDYVKLTKMTKWIYETGWRVAQSAKRPLTIEIKSKNNIMFLIDKPFVSDFLIETIKIIIIK